MYEIHTLVYIPLEAGSNFMAIFDQALEGGTVNRDRMDAAIAVFPTASTAIPLAVNYIPPIKCKQIGIRFELANAFTGFLYIGFDTVPASKKELILEFIKRGKNP